MDHDIVISYTGPVKKKAFAIHDMFQANKIMSWIDKSENYGISYGRDFGGEIIKAIKKCKIFLLVYSEYSNNSEHVLNEVFFASKLSKIIIVVKLDNSEYRDVLSYNLSRRHYIDGTGENWSKAMKQIFSQVLKDLKTDTANSRQTTDQFLLSNGMTSLENKMYEDARKDFQQYIDIDPKNSYARFLLVLSIIRGRKCRDLDGIEVKKIEQLLAPVMYDSQNGYIRHLLAIVKAGYFSLNGFIQTKPSSDELFDEDDVDAEKIRIILKHLYEPDNAVLKRITELY